MANLPTDAAKEWAESIENQMTKFMDYLRDLGVRGNEGETIGDLGHPHHRNDFPNQYTFPIPPGSRLREEEGWKMGASGRIR